MRWGTAGQDAAGALGSRGTGTDLDGAVRFTSAMSEQEDDERRVAPEAERPRPGVLGAGEGEESP